MYPEPIDEYFAPTDLTEAPNLLSRFGANAKILRYREVAFLV